jgi:hypothetical protein
MRVSVFEEETEAVSVNKEMKRKRVKFPKDQGKSTSSLCSLEDYFTSGQLPYCIRNCVQF